MYRGALSNFLTYLTSQMCWGGNTNVQGCFIQLSDVFDESDVLGRQSRTEKSFAVTR